MLLYQLSGFLLLFILAIDLALVLRVIQGVQDKKIGRRYGWALMVFVGLSIFKIFFASPHAFSSTPADLTIKTDKSFDVCYFIDEVKGANQVFWKEHIIGHSKTQSLDLESSVADGFHVVKKMDGGWYVTNVQLNSPHETILNLAEASFQKADPDMTNAIKKYRWTIIGNYFSHFLTLVFLVLVIRIIAKNGF